MANKRISDLTSLTILASNDEFVVVDVSDTSQASTGTNKKILTLDLATAILASDTTHLLKAGDTMTGLLQFSGTGHAGLQLNSLTTTQRNALTPANGMVLYNSTLSQINKYENSQWVDISKSPATKVVAPSGSGIAADYYTTGTSDSTKLQTAITAAAGGSLYITAGTYDIDTTLSIPSNIKIFADWNAIFRMKNSSNTTCMTNSDHVNGNTAIHIYGLQIDMNSANNTTLTNSKAIDFSNVTDSVATDTYIHHIRHAQGQGNVAIGLNKTYNCVIRNNKIYLVGDYGIATNGIQQCKIINNYIQNPAGHGISLEHGDIGGSNERATGNTVTGNTVYYDSSETLNTQQGIKIGTIDDSVISNNVLYCTNLNGGIGITSSENTPGGTANTNYQRGNTISNNTIYGFLIGGIKVVGSLSDSIIGNTITLPYVAASSTYGILIDISVQTGDTHISEEVQITGNTITEQTNTTLTSNSGIIVQGGSNYINISGNIIDNISNTGISTVGGSSYITITGNTIRDSRRSAIYLGAGNSTGSSYCTITGNLLSGGSRDANGAHSEIELHGACLYTTIIGNIFSAPNANKVLYAIQEVDSTVDYTNIANNTVDTTQSGTDVSIQGVNTTVANINTVTTRGNQFASVSTNGINLVLTHLGASNPKKFIRSRGGSLQVLDNGYSNALLTILDGGRTGLKGITSPTSWLHLPAGVATANGSPLKFTSGTNLTTPEDGAVEYNGSHLYITIGSTRYQIDQQGGGTVTSVSGTTNRITSTGGATPVIDISASYVGQSSITTLGTITTGVWNGTAIGASYLPGSFSGFANPSASIGLSANNGSATTAMRSDATPALSQSISPTWTNTHTFTQGSVQQQILDGIRFYNTTASTSGVAVQNSPGLHFLGHVWNTTATAADNTFEFWQQLQQTSGTTPTARLATVVSNNGGGNSTVMTISDTGILNIVSGGAYQINGTTVLSNNTLGSGVTASSLTSVGTLTSLALSGAITDTQSIGATSTDGFVITNTTAAAVGAQQYSPRIRLTGQGWKTTATAASQTVDWIAENRPVQGTTNPTTNLVFASQVNGAGYVDAVTITSGINVGVNYSTPQGKLDLLNSNTGFSATGQLRLINNHQSTSDTTGIHFSTREATIGLGKGWFGFIRTGSFGVGDFIFLNNNTASDAVVGTADEAMRITSTKSVLIGTAALATNVTDGFLYIPTCAGAPTGTPTSQTGRVPMIYDTTNNNFYFYNNGWKKTTTFA